MIALTEWLPILRPSFELFQKLRSRHHLTMEASTHAYYQGDFTFDLDPELYWGATVVVRHVFGPPLTLEHIQYVTYRSFLHRWMRSPNYTKRVKSKKFPNRLEEGAVHSVHVALHAPKFDELASHGKVWIAVRHSASRRPLIARFATYELTQEHHQELWHSYDDGGNTEAEEEYYETLRRIERKREEQKNFFKKQ
jgi:hypothetical protein